MTDMQNVSSSKKKFWVGVLFTLLGVGLLSPLIYRSPESFNNRNVVGPFFGISLGLTFLIVGILRISKSRKPDAVSSSSAKVHKSSSKANKPRTPLFIKLVALSPAIPLCILVIVQAGCDVFNLNTCREHHLFMESMGYFGGLGWIISLPIAGMLKMIHSAARSD